MDIPDTTNEVADFLISLSGDATKRDEYLRNRDAFLAQSGLSADAQSVLRATSQKAIMNSLRARANASVAVGVAVAVWTSVDVVVVVPATESE